MILHKQRFSGTGYVVICWHWIPGDSVLNTFSISTERKSLSSSLVTDHLIFLGCEARFFFFQQSECQNFFFQTKLEHFVVFFFK